MYIHTAYMEYIRDVPSNISRYGNKALAGPRESYESTGGFSTSRGEVDGPIPRGWAV